MQPARRLRLLGNRLETGRIVLYGLGVGAISGVIGTLASLLLEGLQSVLLGDITGFQPPGLPAEGGVLQSYVGDRGWWLPVLCAIAFAGVALWRSRGQPEAINLEPDGVNDALTNFHQHQATSDLRQGAFGLTSSLLANAVGAPLGREGALAFLSNLGATLFARVTNLSADDRRTVFVASLAAFLGIALRAPLAAAVLAVELLYRQFEFEIEALAPAVLSSVVAYAIYGSFRGFAPLFDLPALGGQPPLLLPAFFALGLLEALAATGFVLGLRALREAWSLVRVPLWLRLAAVGAIFGALVLINPAVLGDGLGWTQLTMTSFLPIGTVLLLLIWRSLATMLTASSGVSGGLIIPSLVLGGLIGNLYAQALGSLIPSYPVEPAAFTLTGMAAFLASTVNAPLAATLLITEWSGYELMVPLLLTTAAGYVLTGRQSLLSGQAESRSSSPVHINAYLRGATGMQETPDLLDLLGSQSITVSDEDTERLYRLNVPQPWINQLVRDLEFPADALLVAILRDGHVRVPRGSTTLETADDLVVLATPQAYAKLTGQPLSSDTPPDEPPASPQNFPALERIGSAWNRVLKGLRREKISEPKL
jgi:chloride channel protein, CIC family